MKRLLQLFYAERWQVLLVIGLGFATVGSSVGLLATSAYLIAKAALMPSIAELQVAILGVRFFGIARGVLRYAERYLSHRLTFQILAQLRSWLYAALEPLAPARLLHYSRGDLLTRTISHIDSLQHLYVRAIAPPWVALLVALATSLLIGSFVWQLGLVLLLCHLLIGVAVPTLSLWQSRQPGAKVNQQKQTLNQAVVEAVAGSADIMAANAELLVQQQLAQLSQQLANSQRHLANARITSTSLLNALVMLSTLLMLALGSWFVDQGQLDPLYLAVIGLSTLASFEALGSLIQAAHIWQSSQQAAKAMFELIDAPPAVSDPVEPSNLPTSSQIRFEHVNFGYVENQPVLRDVSFELNPGEIVALQAPSGVGKTTVAHLLLRFWDVQAGAIYLGDCDIRQLRLADLHQHIGYVSQYTELFNGSLRDNLRLANPNTSEDDLVQALEVAQLSDLQAKLPAGLETWIGEQGAKLSGGERQRLALARVLLKPAPILILDEPTAQLDYANEAAWLAALKPLLVDKTVLLISHRTAVQALADRVVQLEKA
ncbi:thiol reductant ABC exporter subunit CydC [Herpetosiphon gulosus]|uniref:ABC transporter ATP-binding/permease protein HI_0664 n=1 Tax=Herpetosiphon gulosus TaxID=1973496 RepID=A0ABP9WT23_9CHLR